MDVSYISGTLLTNDALEQLGSELLGAMTVLKHNGAIEKAQMGFHALCSRQEPLHEKTNTRCSPITIDSIQAAVRLLRFSSTFEED